jgi:L-lactate dehydrogenase complex protein LldF
VILDNGRSAMLADPVLREVLYCLRCGACLNVCPVYRRIGCHAYGVTYSGPIGSTVSPNLFGSAAAHAPFASTLCGACREICPVRIDIPRLLLHLRWKENLGIGAPRVEFPRDVARSRNGMRRFARLAGWPRTNAPRAAGRRARCLALSPARAIRWIPGPFRSWTRGRIVFGSDFPYAPADVAASFTAKLDASDGLTPNEHRAINHRNAWTPFPRLAMSDTSKEVGMQRGETAA